MAEMADADRLRGLPVHIVHGRLDWMFPVQVARQTSQALSAAGADVTYRELDDLSHTYPREMNAEILQWLGGVGRHLCLLDLPDALHAACDRPHQPRAAVRLHGCSAR